MAWNFDRVISLISRFIFYPKELKGIVKDLKRQNNYNPIPLRELDRFNLLFLCLNLIILIIGVFRISQTFDLAITSLCLILGQRLVIKYGLLKVYKAYLYGTKYDGVIVGRSYPKLGTTVLWCKRSIDGEVVKLSEIRGELGKESGVELGKPISYYYSEKHKTKKLPDIEKQRIFNCMRKDLL